ncbi:hypothetical protein [Azospirillum sp. sgz302134]
MAVAMVTLGPVSPAPAASVDKDWSGRGVTQGDWDRFDRDRFGDLRGCLFGYRPGLDVLTPGYNPAPVSGYCPPPVAYYPTPLVAAPTTPLILSGPSRYYCDLPSTALAGNALSRVTGSLCRDGSAVWALPR